MPTPVQPWEVPTTASAITRRHLLQGAVGIGATAALTTSTILTAAGSMAAPADAERVGPPSAATEGALARLIEGNQRFIAGKPRFTHSNRQWRGQLTRSQHPFATVICCSDSRVPPELIFDCGFGDLFTIRLAGNIISEGVLGSLQYASYHLHTPVFVILGHEGCGAVKAAVNALLGQDKEPEHIQNLINMITPGLANLDRNLPLDELVQQGIVANVSWSQKQILRLPEAVKALEENRHQLVGAVYSLESGLVSFL